MCGLVGIISRKGMTSDLTYRDMDAFKYLLVLDTKRGEDSTGAFTALRNMQVAGVKHADVPHNLFKQDAWKMFSAKAISTGRFLIGHNRKATQGAINPENAHPFVEGPITLCHNGTLHNHRKLADAEVDSHAVAKAFATRDYKEVLKEIEGAFCFIWYDTRDSMLRIVRNDERPLGIIETADRYIFSSEVWMATTAAHLYDLTTNLKPAQHVLNNIPTGKVISFDRFGTMSTEDVELFKRQTYTTTYHGRTAVERDASKMDCCLDDDDILDRLSQRVNGGAATKAIPFTQGKESANESASVVSSNNGVLLTRPEGRVSSSALDDYRLKDTIAVEFTKGIQQGKWVRVQGVTRMPFRRQVDVTYVLPLNEDMADAAEMCSGGIYFANIKSMASGVCGPTITIDAPCHDPMVRSFNGILLSETQWYEVVEECKCKVCNRYLSDDEVRITNLKESSEGNGRVTYKATCADCLKSKIQNQEVKDALIARRNLTLEDRVTKCVTSEHSIIGESGAPRTSSLH